MFLTCLILVLPNVYLSTAFIFTASPCCELYEWVLPVNQLLQNPHQIVQKKKTKNVIVLFLSVIYPALTQQTDSWDERAQSKHAHSLSMTGRFARCIVLMKFPLVAEWRMASLTERETYLFASLRGVRPALGVRSVLQSSGKSFRSRWKWFNNSIHQDSLSSPSCVTDHLTSIHF